MNLFNVLLTLHIIAGSLALGSAFVAVLTKTFNASHKWHIYSGNLYVLGMIIIFLTAVPMTILHPNLFLFLIAIFSLYLGMVGWRFAKNRKGIPNMLDWGSAGMLVVTSIAMIIWGIYMLINNNDKSIAIIFFGCFGAGLSVSGIRGFCRGGTTGKERIAKHLGMMLGGTIAVVTAFIVTNFTFQPAFVLWLAPTVVITPINIWWIRRIKRGVKPKGMP